MSWIKELGLVKIALILASAATCIPYVCANEYRNLDATNLQHKQTGNAAFAIDTDPIYGTDGSMGEPTSYSKENYDIKITSNTRDATDIEGSQGISMTDLTRTDEASLRETVALLMRERDELKLINEDLNSFLRYKVDNVAMLTHQNEQLKKDIRKLKEDALHQMKYETRGLYQLYSSQSDGILDSITLRQAGRVMYIIHRVPLELLRYHCKFYAEMERAIVRMVTTDVPKLSHKCSTFYSDVVVRSIDRVFNASYIYLKKLFVLHTEIDKEHSLMKQDLESYMLNKRNMDPELFNNQQKYDWSLNGLRSLLYPKWGHRHCMYWCHALSKDWATVIKKKYTVPKLLLAIYAHKLKDIFNRITIYVVWIICFITFFFLDQTKYSELMYTVEVGVSDIWGNCVVSPSTVKETWSSIIETLWHSFYTFDQGLEMFYNYVATVYPSFVIVFPASINERMGMLAAIIFGIFSLFFCIKYIIRGAIRIVKTVLFGGKRLKPTQNGYDRMQNWYNGSFIRWSFNLLQPKQSAVKPNPPPKIRKKVKYLFTNNTTDETNASNSKKGAVQSQKPVTYWQSVSRRNPSVVA